MFSRGAQFVQANRRTLTEASDDQHPIIQNPIWRT